MKPLQLDQAIALSVSLADVSLDDLDDLYDYWYKLSATADRASQRLRAHIHMQKVHDELNRRVESDASTA